MQHLPIFEVPIFIKKADKHKEVKQYIMDNIYPEYEKSGPNSDSLANVFSDYFPGAPLTDQKLFGELYKNDFNDLFNYIGLDPNLSWNISPMFWYNITGEGGYQEQHDHVTGPLPVQFSAIHYVWYDKNVHQAAEFLHPMEQIIRSTFPSENRAIVPDYFKSLNRSPKLEEGDIVFFPSWLKHIVLKQKAKKPRISVAMNIGIIDNSLYGDNNA